MDVGYYSLGIARGVEVEALIHLRLVEATCTIYTVGHVCHLVRSDSRRMSLWRSLQILTEEDVVVLHYGWCINKIFWVILRRIEEWQIVALYVLIYCTSHIDWVFRVMERLVGIEARLNIHGIMRIVISAQVLAALGTSACILIVTVSIVILQVFYSRLVGDSSRRRRSTSCLLLGENVLTCLEVVLVEVVSHRTVVEIFFKVGSSRTVNVVCLEVAILVRVVHSTTCLHCTCNRTALKSEVIHITRSFDVVKQVGIYASDRMTVTVERTAEVSH